MDENTPLSELSLPEIADLIEEVMEEYYESEIKDRRKELRKEYTMLVEYYNEASGIKAYNLNL